MSARDLFHRIVVEALRKDGWLITHDPLTINYGGRETYVDIGAELNTIGADKNGTKRAVEVKSFLNTSVITDLHRALGQYILYEVLLEELDPDRKVYLAVSTEVFNGIFSEPIGQLLIERRQLRLLIFDIDQAEVVKWIN